MLLDIGVGILLGVLFDSISQAHSLSTFVLFGVFSTLSPDIDYIYHLISGGTSKNDHRHREVLHNPLFLVAGWIIIAIFFSQSLAWLFVLGALSHFVHDSIGIGWGVQWLSPLKRDHYTFFYRVHTADKPKPPKKLIYVWPNNKLDFLQNKYGDPDWFRNTYIKMHPFAIVETTVFITALLVLLSYIND